MVLRVVGSLDPAAIDICRRANIELRVESQVSESTLRQRYEGCRFLLSPSLDEGHNLPIAEALSFGANVLCSDIPAHREFYGDRVAFFDPLDVDAIAHAIDLFWMHEGNWFPGVLAPTRSFADVAADYRALFSQVR